MPRGLGVTFEVTPVTFDGVPSSLLVALCHSVCSTFAGVRQSPRHPASNNWVRVSSPESVKGKVTLMLSPPSVTSPRNSYGMRSAASSGATTIRFSQPMWICDATSRLLSAGIASRGCEVPCPSFWSRALYKVPLTASAARGNEFGLCTCSWTSKSSPPGLTALKRTTCGTTLGGWGLAQPPSAATARDAATEEMRHPRARQLERESPNMDRKRY